MNSFELIEKLEKMHTLSTAEYEQLILSYSDSLAEFIAQKAVKVREQIYGNKVYIRGLIEISNICKNDCLYCGIRKSNIECERYRLSSEEILECCDSGYDLGFRTFVLQGGEDGFFNDSVLCDIVYKIKSKYGDCAVTLSVGERSYDSYKNLYNAGADRYLLRHETASLEHYNKLHPATMSFENRIKCLYNLREIGYQVGCGFMVGSPYQTAENLAKDLKFIEEFNPDMCGIGPFIPHKNTQFKNEKAGTVELTCFLLSIIRLICPDVLLPATTALGTIDSNGREKGIMSGANVVMPNLSPNSVRKKYTLYDNKLCTGEEAAERVKELDKRMKNIGYEIVIDCGNRKGWER